MIRMANRLSLWERKRLRRKTEEAKKRGGVSASLFLEGEMNVLSDADCFFFYGNRLRPKILLTVFFPDEEHAEITVAEFVPEEKAIQELFRCAIRECRRVGVEQIHTVRDPVCGFDMAWIKGISFCYNWSEYMLRMKVRELADSGAAQLPANVDCKKFEIRKEKASEDDGTFRYALLQEGQETAECRILPVAEGMQCYLFGLKTKEEFRRMGMATRLLTEIAKEYAVREDAVMRLQVSSKNEPAERLYRKLGFVTEEEREYYKTEEC